MAGTGELIINAADPGDQYADIVRLVRVLLTGDPESDAPPAETLSFYASDSLLEMFLANPCISDGQGNPSLSLSAIDTRLFQRAAAADIALRILSSPGGGEYEATVIKTTTDNVDETMQKSVTLADALKFLQGERGRMLARISCIARSRSAAPFMLMDVVGRSRAQEANCRNFGAYPGFLPGGFWYRLGYGE